MISLALILAPSRMGAQDAPPIPQLTETRLWEKIGRLSIQVDVLTDYIAQLQARINRLETENKALKEK